jgi:hypothetical protein
MTAHFIAVEIFAAPHFCFVQRLSPHFPQNLFFVTAAGNSPISLVHRQEPGPFSRSQISGKPPIPSKRLAMVAFRS